MQKSGNDNVCNYIRLSTWHTHSSWGYSQVLPLLCGQRDGRNISFTIRTVILSSHNFGTWTFQTLLSHRHCFFDMKYLSINGQRASSYGLIRARGRLIHTRALTPNWYYDSAPVQKLQTLQQVSCVIQDKSLFNMVWRTSVSYQYKILLFSELLIANNPAEELYSASLTQNVSQTGLKHSCTQSHQTPFLHPQNETVTYCLFSKLITILPKHGRGWIRKLAPVKI